MSTDCVPLKALGEPMSLCARTRYYRNRGFVRASLRYIFAEGLETPGRIEIDTPDEPHLQGYVCLGVAK
jgi:hypothetical protein